MTHSVVLLNDGVSRCLLNDGTSLALLNAAGPAHAAGIQISGTHPIADLRGLGAGKRPKRKSRQICLMFNGKIRCFFPMPSKGRLFTKIETKLESKIVRTFKPIVISKLWKSRTMEMRSRLDKENKLVTEGKLPFKPYKDPKAKEKKKKLDKLKKFYNIYKEFEE